MAYTVVRARFSGWRDRFKNADQDTDFQVDTFPELDDYLSMMEERGWTIVSTDVMVLSSSFMLITMHRGD
ncbi:MAG: hypothetical protein FWD55_00995 [Propionibacteriaceae bacterium]|nr:hypothetical protein [Propionibacteriaceae bacterium]